jgi:integrase/recombinase XerD
MTKINELIEDFKLNHEILGREKKYVDLCLFRLYSGRGSWLKS